MFWLFGLLISQSVSPTVWWSDDVMDLQSDSWKSLDLSGLWFARLLICYSDGCQPTSLSVGQTIRLSYYQSFCRSVRLMVCHSVGLLVSWSEKFLVFQFVGLSVSVSFFVWLALSLYLFLSLSVFVCHYAWICQYACLFILSGIRSLRLCDVVAALIVTSINVITKINL